LLQKASSLRKSSATGVLAPDTHRSWREQHKLALAETGESMDVLQQFINAQQASGDACSSRLLESKRVLDGLLKDLKSLSSQVDSHEEVLETETSNLNITELSVKAVEVTHIEAMTVCEKEKQDAADRVSQYQSELAELDQIAKPSVRLEHVTKVETSEGRVSSVTKSSLTGKSSLLQEGLWSKESCLAFVDFQRRKHKTKLRQNSTKKQDPDDNNDAAPVSNNDNNNDNNNNESPIPEKVDCDSQREELQKAFTEAYITTRNLLKESQSDVEDTTCVDTAEAKKAADLVPLVSERERAASLIESSSQAIAALEPVLDLIDSRVEKLSDHIYNTLTPECAEAKEVSEALQKIRELILLLEECPGRNDFKLKIPEETEEKEKAVDEVIEAAGEAAA